MRSALANIPGLTDVIVKKGSATLKVPGAIKDEQILSAISAVGFEATVK